MNKYVNPFELPAPEPYTVEGTTMTIPNLAPSLIEIIASSSSDGLPYSSLPIYDEDDNSGLVRVKSRSTLNEVFDFGENLGKETDKVVPTNEEVSPSEEQLKVENS